MSTSNKTSLLLPYYEYFIIMCSLVCFSGVVKCAPTAAKTVVALAYHDHVVSIPETLYYC